MAFTRCFNILKTLDYSIQRCDIRESKCLIGCLERLFFCGFHQTCHLSTESMALRFASGLATLKNTHALPYLDCYTVSLIKKELEWNTILQKLAA
jgi:hypothetical protein